MWQWEAADLCCAEAANEQGSITRPAGLRANEVQNA